MNSTPISTTKTVKIVLAACLLIAPSMAQGPEKHISAHAICAFTAEFDVEHYGYKYVGQPGNPRGKARVDLVTTNHPEEFRPLRKLGLLLADHYRANDNLPWNPRYKNEAVRCVVREGPSGYAFWERARAEAEDWVKRYRSEGWDSGMVTTFWDDRRNFLRNPIKPLNSDWQGPTRYEGP